MYLHGEAIIVQVFSYTIVDKACAATSSGPCLSKTNLKQNQSHSRASRISLGAEKVGAGEIMSPEFHLLKKNKKLNPGNPRDSFSVERRDILFVDFKICSHLDFDGDLWQV